MTLEVFHGTEAL